MSTAPDSTPRPAASSPTEAHPLRTIRDIRAALPEDQQGHFDAQLAETDIDDLSAVLTRWATLGTDGFLDWMLTTPFEGLEFGERSYDEQADDK